MIRILFTTFVTAFLFSSCVITEDIHFAENGSVKYQLSIDMSEMAKSMGTNSMPAGLPSEPISIVQMLKDSIGDTSALSDVHKQILENLTPFYFRPKVDTDGEEFAFEVYGDFKDVNQLNTGLIALNDSKQLESIFKSKQGDVDDQTDEAVPSQLDGISIAGKLSTFSWNGKTMQRTYLQTEEDLALAERQEIPESIDDGSLMGNMMNKMLNPLMKMLEMGQYQSRYHFPTKVDRVNIEYDELSEDRKTVIFNQEGLNFVEPTSNKIIINLKK